MNVGAFETLFTHTIITAAIILLQPFVNFLSYSIPDNSRGVSTRFVLRAIGKEVLNSGFWVFLNGCLIGIDQACDRLAVSSSPASYLSLTELIYSIVVKNLLFKIHRNH